MRRSPLHSPDVTAPGLAHHEAMSNRPDDLIDGVVIRHATSDDAASLEILAELDSARPPDDPVLVAERGGDVVAALPLSGGPAIANPFLSTSDAVELLKLRAHQLRLTQSAIGSPWLVRRATASRQSVSHTRNRFHRFLKRPDVAVEHLHRDQQPIQHRR